MNRAASRRLISKQEAVVLLGDLELFSCTDTIESVSISNSKTLRESTGDKNANRTFVQQYQGRPKSFHGHSLYEYFHHVKNHSKKQSPNRKVVIPNFVGINGTPKFPVTESYARHVLIAYKPWTTYPKSLKWIDEFNNFINTNQCPSSAKVSYFRVMRRHYDKTTGYEPKTATVEHGGNSITEEDADLITLMGLNGSENVDSDSALLASLDRGLQHKWDATPQVSNYCAQLCMPSVSILSSCWLVD